MIDVHTWDWDDPETRQRISKALVDIQAAMRTVDVEGVLDPEGTERTHETLRAAVAAIEAALATVDCPSPVPHAYLAIGCSLAGFTMYERQQSPEAQPFFDRAVEAGRRAETLYENATGWNPAGRYDLRVAMALAHFNLSGAVDPYGNFGEALARIEAAADPPDGAVLVNTGDLLVERIDSIKSNLPELSSRRGCLGLVVATLGLLTLIALAV